jgi:hypothetical protein
MSTHLKLGQGAIIKGFAGTAQDEQNFIYSLANNCRDNFQPIFANETQYLPLTNELPLNIAVTPVVSQDISVTPVVAQNISVTPVSQFPIVTSSSSVPVFEAQSNTSDNNQPPVYSGNLTKPPTKQDDKKEYLLEMAIVAVTAALITKIFL